MTLQTDDIQAGWEVCSSDGHDVGKVVRIEGPTLVIKHGGLLRSHEWRVPRTAVSDVETGRVELSITKSELQQQQKG